MAWRVGFDDMEVLPQSERPSWRRGRLAVAVLAMACGVSCGALEPTTALGRLGRQAWTM